MFCGVRDNPDDAATKLIEIAGKWQMVAAANDVLLCWVRSRMLVLNNKDGAHLHFCMCHVVYVHMILSSAQHRA